MIDMMKPIYLNTPSDDEAQLIWNVVLRKVSTIVDLVVRPLNAVVNADKGMILPGNVESMADAFRALAAVCARRAELDEQEDLAEFADILSQAVEVTLEEIEDPEEFYPAICACLDQVFGHDMVIVQDENGNDMHYQVMFRKEIDEVDYSLLMPMDDENGSVLILRTIYDDDMGEINFEDADEQTSAAVFAEFCEIFSDEDDPEA